MSSGIKVCGQQMEHDIESRPVSEPYGSRDGIIGSRVCKRFGFRMFRGVVKSFDPEVSWYCVKYEDSDQEEVDEEELREILVDSDALSYLHSSNNQSTSLKRKACPSENNYDRSLDPVKGAVLDSRPKRKWLSGKLAGTFEVAKKSCRPSNENGFMKSSSKLVVSNSRSALFPDEITQQTVVLSTDREPRGNHSYEQIFPFSIPKNQTTRYSKRLKMEHRKPLEWPIMPNTSGGRIEDTCDVSPMNYAQKVWNLPNECTDVLSGTPVDIIAEEMLDQEHVHRAKNIQLFYYEEWIKQGSLDRGRFRLVKNVPKVAKMNVVGNAVQSSQVPNENNAGEKSSHTRSVIGHVPGIPVDLHVQLWGELHCLGIHSPQNGMDCVDILECRSETGTTLPLALSIVVMRKGNKPRSMNGDEVVYQRMAHSAASKLGTTGATQKQNWSDEGLLNSHKFGIPIRLVQYIKDSTCAMNYRYSYKGLWWVVGAWSDLDSPKFLKFRLGKISNRQLTSYQLKQIPKDHFICEDFSFGMEAKKISVVNNVDSSLPPGILQDSNNVRSLIGYKKDDSWFEYTHKYMHHPSVPQPPTPEQKFDTDPHTMIERLNMCKPYLVRNSAKIPLLNQRRCILFECGPWCNCKLGKKCHYAVTERGIQFKLQVFKTQGKGWGLRTLEYIPAGAYVTTYTGLIIPQKDASSSAGTSEYTFEMCRRTDMSDDNQFLDELRSDIEVRNAAKILITYFSCTPYPMHLLVCPG